MFQKPVYKTNNGLIDFNNEEMISFISILISCNDITDIVEKHVDKINLHAWKKIIIRKKNDYLVSKNFYQYIKPLFISDNSVIINLNYCIKIILNTSSDVNFVMKLQNEVSYRDFLSSICENPNLIEYIENNFDYIKRYEECFYSLCKNPAALHLIEDFYHDFPRNEKTKKNLKENPKGYNINSKYFSEKSYAAKLEDMPDEYIKYIKNRILLAESNGKNVHNIVSNDIYILINHNKNTNVKKFLFEFFDKYIDIYFGTEYKIEDTNRMAKYLINECSIEFVNKHIDRFTKSINRVVNKISELLTYTTTDQVFEYFEFRENSIVNRDYAYFTSIVQNPAFTHIFANLDTDIMKKNNQAFSEELSALFFNPNRISKKIVEYGISYEEYNNIF